MTMISRRWSTVLLLVGAVLLLPLAPSAATAQGAPAESVTVVFSRLFDAMRSRDTAATRAAFVANGRVLPVPERLDRPDAPELSVSQFVAFVAGGTGGAWTERIWNPRISISGSLASAWFDYDVWLGTTFSHCGVNAVQLQRTAGGWRIVSMAFTRRRQACPPRDAPTGASDAPAGG